MAFVRYTFGFCVKGYRSYQQDTLYPELEQAHSSSQVWVVCDGVGGNPCGDQASSIVSRRTAAHLKAGKPLEALSKYLSEAIQSYVSDHPDCQGTSTTLTFVRCLRDGLQIGWCGDSRVYHFRKGKQLYRSRDHSLV